MDEAKNQIYDLEHKEGKKHSIRTGRRKKNPKIKGNVRNLWDNFKCINIWIIGFPEGEEEEQEIENLFEKIRKENFPNLANEIDIQAQEEREFQTSWTQRGTHQDASQLKCQRLKIKRKS